MAETSYKMTEDRKEVPEAHPPAPSLLQTGSSPSCGTLALKGMRESSRSGAASSSRKTCPVHNGWQLSCGCTSP